MTLSRIFWRKKSGLARDKVLALLPGLWHEIEGHTGLIGKFIWRLHQKPLEKISAVCWDNGAEAHGVEYIGHVIEDNNAHQRLGHGCGHYFRALDGQDMEALILCFTSIFRGITDMEHMAWIAEKRADPAFFRYTLPKLASSHGHIQPLKKGRAMCEIYGGFGWVEGIPEMKQMTDLMLSGGINHFVPHAFNPKFPDADHPPHFYARGMNPQFPVFKDLMEYVKRMCHILSGGIHQAEVAVYYNAEAEWTGGKYRLIQDVCRS